ncbi:hypothetical protein HYT02_00265 [Candidatus Gottesmanbacteria bacterium]|nr:hypothetical protein [Candidatus Gottesmanbacteria bacterium]
MISKEMPGMVDSLDYGQQVNEGMNNYFGEGLVSHWTLKLPENNGMTAGGLHRTSEGAEQSRKRHLGRITNHIYAGLEVIKYTDIRKKIQQLKNAVVFQLEEGQRYEPVGVGGKIFTHGLDDGTHKSRIKVNSTLLNAARRILKVG